MRLNKLREKQVVNVLDGRALGYISDIVLDPGHGLYNFYCGSGTYRAEMPA